MVIGVRARRDADSWAKRVSAGLFYRLFSRLTRGRVVANAGDYRLMDRVVVDALNALPERVRFTKGLYGWVGFRSAIVAYERPARVAGSSKWPGWKLWNFALDGITSFSIKPISGHRGRIPRAGVPGGQGAAPVCGPAPYRHG